MSDKRAPGNTQSVLLLTALSATILGTSPPADFARVTREWRLNQVAALKRDRGWLSVAGLFWLDEGENSFGSDSAPKIRLPDGPPVAGSFTRRGKEVFLESPAEGVTVNNSVPTAAALSSDSAGRPDSIRVGRLEMNVMQRGDRVGIRLYDSQAESRTKFKGGRGSPPTRSGSFAQSLCRTIRQKQFQY